MTMQMILGFVALLALTAVGCSGQGRAYDPTYHRCSGGGHVTRYTGANPTARSQGFDGYETSVWVACGL